MLALSALRRHINYVPLAKRPKPYELKGGIGGPLGRTQRPGDFSSTPSATVAPKPSTRRTGNAAGVDGNCASANALMGLEQFG